MKTADVLKAWFDDRPKWLQLAAITLIEKGYEALDPEFLMGACIAEAQGNPVTLASDLDLNNLAPTGGPPLRLKSISEVKNINALAPKKPLDFGDGNLTAIYGGNASGKSGYVRILKQVSGARNKESFLPNIYKTSSDPMQCKITYHRSGDEISAQWQSDSGTIGDLTSVDIFDSATDNLFLTTEHEITYEPPLLTFFTDLINICQSVAAILDAQITQIPAALPTIPAEYASTSVAALYNSLSKDVSNESLDAICQWSETEIAQLAVIHSRLGTKSPLENAAQYRNKWQHLTQLVNSTQALEQQLSDKHCQAIIDLRIDADRKMAIAESDALKMFESAPLQGVGTVSWRDLWERARIFSHEHAYPEESFPYTGESSKCVLCQQNLEKDAPNRLQSFESFVVDKLRTSASTADKQAIEAINALSSIPSDVDLSTKQSAAGVDHLESITLLTNAYSAFRNRKSQLPQVSNTEELDAIPDMSEWYRTVKTQANQYDELARTHEKDSKVDNRIKLQARSIQLSAQKWASEQRASINAEIKRLKLLNELTEAKRLTTTTGLSFKKGEIAEVLITQEFVDRFHSELKNLGGDKIAIELTQTRVARGHVLHELRLQSTADHALVDVLSQGERRVISLATFLADVGEKQTVSPFIFDDPITSLDQEYEEAVVQRLIRLARDRQVIIFTHRLSFLGLLQDYAKQDGQEPKIISLRKEYWGTGEPGETALFAKKPIKALNSLLSENVARSSKVLQEQGQIEYEPLAKSICSDFRIILERIIEIDLLSDVIQRYRRAVTTVGKLAHLSKITDADCKLFDDMLTKYSRYEHSQPADAPVPLPNPDELESDMNEIVAWHSEFRDR